MNVFSGKPILIFWVGMLCIFLTAAATVSHAQEVQLPYNKVSYNLYDMKFLNAKNGWLCGKSGLVFRTEDGGLTWRKVDVGTDDSLFGIVWMNDKRGIMVGQKGLVLATEDSGQTWQKVQVPVSMALFTVDFVDEHNGMACGDWGKIISTTDGGKTWQDTSLKEDIMLYSIKYTGPEEAWIAAEGGKIFHTVDGGKTWDKKAVAEGSLFGIGFDKHGNGVAVGIDGTAVVTADNGANWVSHSVSKGSLYNVAFNDLGALIVGDVGTVFALKLKTDGSYRLADTFEKVDTPVSIHTNWLRCVASIEGNGFVIAGARGSISFVKDMKLVSPGA